VNKTISFRRSFELTGLICLLISVQLVATAQTTSISGVINAYSPVTAINAGNNVLTISNPGAFAAGDLVLIVQMKGATIDNTTVSALSGTLTGTGIAGVHEFSTIQSVAGNVATLQYSLCNTYDPANLVQLVRVPTYVDALVTAPLTCQAWNGTDGGILVLYATGNVTLNANINCDGLGYLGGAICNGSFGCGSALTYVGASVNCGGGGKGEGISLMIPFSFPTNLGRLANGGGGSNNGNNGGAGGGNGGAGGRSGDEYSGCNTTNVWAIGGDASLPANGRILMGGGGGGGFADNGSVATAGGNAGGTVFIVANTFDGNGNTISSKGADVAIIANDEGSGGGGAGGSVYLHCDNFASALTVDLTGGFGGSNFNNVFQSQCHGTGGGGGGGQVWVEGPVMPAAITTVLTGGVAGTVNQPSSVCFGTTYNATAGADGVAYPNLMPINTGGAIVSLGNDTVICSGTGYILNAGVFTSYLWSTGATTASIPVTTSGTYWVQVASCGGGSSADTIVIQINTSPVPNLGADVTICSYDSVVLSPGVFPATLWSTGAVTSTITTSAAGTYSVLVTDANGCTGTDTKLVTVANLDALMVANAVDSLCISSPFLLGSVSVGVPTTYVWNLGDGTIVNNVANVTHNFANYGNYVYTLWIQNAIGCVDSITDSVYVASSNPIYFRLLDSNICVGEPIYCFDSLTELSSSWVYSFGDNTIARDQNNPIHAYAQAGTYTIDLQSANLVCPATTSSIVVTVENLPAVNIGSDTSYCSGYNSPIILSNQSQTGGDYFWNTGGASNTISAATPGAYWLRVVSSNGCVGSDSMVIHEDCYLNIPNAFSPNADGLNDNFIPLDLLSSGLTKFEMQVFNRWGEVIFTTANVASSGWDGKYGGKPQPMGAYVYMIKAVFKDGSSKQFNGNVTLIR
jgi:gliding motility-associated-like protein